MSYHYNKPKYILRGGVQYKFVFDVRKTCCHPYLETRVGKVKMLRESVGIIL